MHLCVGHSLQGAAFTNRCAALWLSPFKYPIVCTRMYGTSTMWYWLFNLSLHLALEAM